MVIDLARNWKLGILDWNGTLVDDFEQTYQTSLIILKLFGLTQFPTRDQYRQQISSRFWELYYHWGVPKHIDPQALNALRERLIKQLAIPVALSPGSGELITFCQQNNIRLGIVSGEIQQVLTQKTTEFDIAQHFDFIIGDAFLKDRAIKTIIDKEQLRPGEVFFIDDHPDYLEQARSLGVITLGYTAGYSTRVKLSTADPDWLINHLTDAISILQSVS